MSQIKFWFPSIHLAWRSTPALGDSDLGNYKDPLNPYFVTSIFCEILTRDLVRPFRKVSPRGHSSGYVCVKLQNWWWWHVIRCAHDDVTKWKYFPRYIFRSPVNSPRPVTRSFDIFFDLCLNKRLSKQSQGWWFETQSRSLWRHCNDLMYNLMICPLQLATDVTGMVYISAQDNEAYEYWWIPFTNWLTAKQIITRVLFLGK